MKRFSAKCGALGKAVVFTESTDGDVVRLSDVTAEFLPMLREARAALKADELADYIDENIRDKDARRKMRCGVSARLDAAIAMLGEK